MLLNNSHGLPHITLGGVPTKQNRQIRQLHLHQSGTAIAMYVSGPMIARVNHHLKPILADERRHESDDTVLVGVGKGFRVSPIADEPLSKQSLLRPRELRQQSFGFLKCGHV